MEIGIIGAGAMGCLYACLLSGQHRVTLYDVSPAVVDTINRQGVTLCEPDGTQTVYSVPAQFSGQGMTAPELLILFVKDLYSAAALETNRALIGAHTRVLSLQNGMGNEEILRQFVPGERVLLGTTKHNCVTKTPGVIYHSGAGITHIGAPEGGETAAAPVVAAFAASGIETAYCPGVRHLLWEKLFVNMTINPVTALLDCPIGVIGEDPDARALAAALIDEAVAVAAADGETFDAAAIKESLWHTTRALSTGRASMCQDLEHGRRTEIDFINGAVVRLGEQYGIAAPTHRALVRLIHIKEAAQKQA